MENGVLGISRDGKGEVAVFEDSKENKDSVNFFSLDWEVAVSQDAP